MKEGECMKQLMSSACDWLKDRGLLVMHVEQRYLQRAICSKPPMLQFYHLISLFDSAGFYEQPRSSTIFSEEWIVERRIRYPSTYPHRLVQPTG
jgi:hypothetical protein